MTLIYLSHWRIPSEKTMAPLILKTCESFVTRGLDVELWVPRRRNPGFAHRDPYDAHGIRRVFVIRRLPALDLSGVAPGWIAFVLLIATFNVAVWWALLVRRA